MISITEFVFSVIGITVEFLTVLWITQWCVRYGLVRAAWNIGTRSFKTAVPWYDRVTLIWCCIVRYHWLHACYLVQSRHTTVVTRVYICYRLCARRFRNLQSLPFPPTQFFAHAFLSVCVSWDGGVGVRIVLPQCHADATDTGRLLKSKNCNLALWLGDESTRDPF